MNNHKKSVCCNSETSEVFAFYNSTMKLDNGEPISKVPICLNCGHRCETNII